VLACSLSSVLLPAATADPVAGGTISSPVAAALALPPLGLTGPPARSDRCAIPMPSPPLPLGEAPRLATGPAPTRIRELAPTDLALTWPGAAAPAFRHLNATVRRGQWLIIIEGRSGAGRPTLLGHLPVMEGSWQANGSGSTAFDAGQLRRRIAWCPRRRTCSTPPSAATACSPEDRTTGAPRRRARGSRPRGPELLTRADVMLLGEPPPTSTPPPPTRSWRTCAQHCPTASSFS
jgi:hypothetical protein